MHFVIMKVRKALCLHAFAFTYICIHAFSISSLFRKFLHFFVEVLRVEISRAIHWGLILFQQALKPVICCLVHFGILITSQFPILLLFSPPPQFLYFSTLLVKVPNGANWPKKAVELAILLDSRDTKHIFRLTSPYSICVSGC